MSHAYDTYLEMTGKMNVKLPILPSKEDQQSLVPANLTIFDLYFIAAMASGNYHTPGAAAAAVHDMLKERHSLAE